MNQKSTRNKIERTSKGKGKPMRRRDVGRILMAAGVFFGIIYTLINLSEASSSTNRLGNLILYTGIVALASGLILLAIAGEETIRKAARNEHRRKSHDA